MDATGDAARQTIGHFETVALLLSLTAILSHNMTAAAAPAKAMTAQWPAQAHRHTK